MTTAEIRVDDLRAALKRLKRGRSNQSNDPLLVDLGKDVSICRRFDQFTLVERIPGRRWGGPDRAEAGFRSLERFARAVEAETVKISPTASGLLVRADGVEVRSGAAHPFDGYGIVGDDEEPVTVPAKVVAAMRRVAFAASADESRPILCGIHVDGTLVQATDAYRIAAVRLHRRSPVSLLLPAAAARYLPADGDVDAWIDPSSIRWDTDTGMVRADRISGSFPHTAGFFKEAKGATVRITADRAALVAAAKSVQRIAGDDLSALRLHATATELSVTAGDRDVGEATKVLPARAQECRQAFNPAYFVEGLEAFDTDEVTLAGSDYRRPWAIQDGRFTYLLMPVRRSDWEQKEAA